MKSKTLVLLGLAVVFGLIASFLTSKVLSDRNNNAGQEEDDRVTVLVAKQNLAYGQKLDVPENYFEEKQYSPDNVPARAVTNATELKDRLLATAIKKGIPITKDDLLAPELVGLQGKMPAGKRGVAIQTNAVAAAGGLILPDNHVDVMLTTNADTKVILSNMLVLAVDTHQKVEAGSSIIPQTVTLLADPDQAAVLTHAQSKGRIQLTVRPFNDSTDSSKVRVTDQDLGTVGNRGEGKGEDVVPGSTELIALKQVTPKQTEKAEETPAEPAPPAKKKRAFVQVLYNGGERIINYFDDETGKSIPAAEAELYDLPGKKQ
jgi:pilus assembly protein CpaB